MATWGQKTWCVLAACCLVWRVTLTLAMDRDSCPQWQGACFFSRLKADVLPSSPPDVTLPDVDNQGACALLCQQGLGRNCSHVAFHRKSRMCRLYSDPASRASLQSAVGHVIFIGCQVLVNGTCTTTADCSVPHVECLQGRCQCVVAYRPLPDLGICVPNLVGDGCSVDMDCFPGNTVCTGGTCRCVSKHHWEPSTGTCDRNLVNDTCATAADCYPANTVCSATTCQCAAQHHWEPDTETCDPNWPGDPCQAVGDCFFTGAACTTRKCQCPSTCGDFTSGTAGCTPTACVQLLKAGQTRSGVYTLDLQDGGPTFQAYCDMTTDGGGWTVFLRRQDGSVNFTRTWLEYKNGFGSVAGEHWLGNDLLARLTAASKTELRADLTDWNYAKAFAQYSTFLVQPASTEFTVSIGGYCGTAGDGLTINGNKFSTWDNDNDGWPTNNCAAVVRGGFWYAACSKSTTTGVYPGTDPSAPMVARWGPWSSVDLRFIELKIR